MTSPTPITAWAIKAPDGFIYYSGLEGTKRKAICRFMVDFVGNDKPWSYFKRQGYRCVRVKVEEMIEG
jgi:hypothetical protein